MTHKANTIALRRLRRAELPTDTVQLARYLIGKIVVHDTDDGRLSGRTVETEAYPVGDSAGHAFCGETRIDASLFLGRGYAHAYFTYGSFIHAEHHERSGRRWGGCSVTCPRTTAGSIGCNAFAEVP